MPSRPRLDNHSPRELAELMRSTNGPLRDLIQQELLWRQANDADVDSELLQVAHDANWPAAEIQALATLASRGQLPAGALIAALESSQPQSRRALVQLSESLLPDSQPLRETINKLSMKATPEVDIQIAFSIADIPQSERIALLMKLILHSDRPWLKYAALTSLKPQDVTTMWANLDHSDSPIPLDFYRSLIKLAASDQNASQELIIRIMAPDSKIALPRRWRLLSEWLRESSAKPHKIATSLRIQLSRQSDVAMKALLDDPTENEFRIAALELITELVRPSAGPLRRKLNVSELESVTGLLAFQHSPEVQSAALVALDALTPDDEPPLFLDRWETASPRLRNEMVERVLTRRNWIRRLLELIVNGQIKLRELNATQREQLKTLADSDLAELAKKAFASFATNTRTEVLEQWKGALQLTGAYETGRGVFAKHCAACHLFDGVGHNVGPDLAALTNRTPASLFVAILDPNSDIDSRYLNVVALTSDGQTLSGLMAEETAVSVTLKEREGKTHVLLRRDLEEMRPGKLSAMPEGIEKDFSQQDLSDLITYLIQPRVPPKSFTGNHPRMVAASSDGRFELLASEAEIHGKEIVFESNSPFKNIGFWHGVQDRVVWKFECNDPGRFDVSLDYACASESAGNQFSVRVGQSQLTGVVDSTGAWTKYRQVKIGSVDLIQGVNHVRVGFSGTKKAAALFDLRGVVITPKGRSVPTPRQPAKALESR